MKKAIFTSVLLSTVLALAFVSCVSTKEKERQQAEQARQERQEREQAEQARQQQEEQAKKQQAEQQRRAIAKIWEGNFYAYQFERYKNSSLSRPQRGNRVRISTETYGAPTSIPDGVTAQEPSEQDIDHAISAYEAALNQWPQNDRISGRWTSIDIESSVSTEFSVAATKSEVQAFLERARNAKQQFADTRQQLQAEAALTTPNSQEDFNVTQNTAGGVTITSYKGTRKYVIIPNTLYGQKVMAIDNGAFYEEGLVSVVIPDTVEQIGSVDLVSPSSGPTLIWDVNGAFAGNNLQSLTLGKGLKVIGKNAFKGNRRLAQVTIPDTVFMIGSSAFENCGLNSIQFGKDVTAIQNSAFMNNNLTELQLPASLLGIDSGAFSGNKIQSVTLPNKIMYVYGSSFGDQLTTLVIPQSLRDRGDDQGIYGRSFPGSLTRITLPANMDDRNLAAFESNLINFYKSQGKKAGTYVKNGPVWVMQ